MALDKSPTDIANLLAKGASLHVDASKFTEQDLIQFSSVRADGTVLTIANSSALTIETLITLVESGLGINLV